MTIFDKRLSRRVGSVRQLPLGRHRTADVPDTLP